MGGMHAPPAPTPKPTAKDVTPYPDTTQPPAHENRTIDITVKPIVADGVDADSGHFVKVDPSVFPNIANALDQLVGPLDEKLKPLGTIALKPGHFNAALDYRDLIGGPNSNKDDGNLVDTYTKNIGMVVQIFENMVIALKKLGETYATADDMSNANANDVQKIMSGVLAPLGQNVPTTVPNAEPQPAD